MVTQVAFDLTELCRLKPEVGMVEGEYRWKAQRSSGRIALSDAGLEDLADVDHVDLDHSPRNRRRRVAIQQMPAI